MIFGRREGRRAAPLVDEAALVELLPRVRRWIARYAGPRADIDDLVQEALTELVASSVSFRGDSSLTTFAYRVVVRTTARQLRKQRAAVSLPDSGEGVDAIDPERRLVDHRAVAELYEAMDALSPKLREAFVLGAVEQMPHAEAAELAGASVETFRARLKRARAELAQRLDRSSAISFHVYEENRT